MKIPGYIPTQISYVCGKAEKITEYFDDSDEIMSTNTIRQTWPIEHGKSLDRAIDWAGKGHKIFTVDNLPINSITIVGLEERGNGGRAYKVLIDNLYYVDMREDIILDTIFNCSFESEDDVDEIDCDEFLEGEYEDNEYLFPEDEDESE